MTHISFITRTLSILAVGLMFTGTAQAQTQDVKITKAVVVQEKTQVCVYKISGSSENMAGMTCSYGTGKVETALLGVAGIISVDAVDIETGMATVTIATESEAKELIPAAIAEVNFVATLVEDVEEAAPATSD